MLPGSMVICLDAHAECQQSSTLGVFNFQQYTLLHVRTGRVSDCFRFSVPTCKKAQPGAVGVVHQRSDLPHCPQLLADSAPSLTSPQVVDNSSAFRMSDGVPLIIPEVNADALGGMKAGKGGIVANPNCSTIIALMAVTPLHRVARVKRMVVSTYQVWFPP